MKSLVFNPYLPEWGYIPDGEPKIFNGRVYIYGSHDMAGGKHFCLGDYVCWSAPEEDLSDWRYEGVIYEKTQDPLNRDGKHNMYAPDVTKGADGRYYLYYGLDMTGKIAVAVCDEPAGKYEYYGVISRIDGTPLTEEFPYDPVILYEDTEHIYLY